MTARGEKEKMEGEEEKEEEEGSRGVRMVMGVKDLTAPPIRQPSLKDKNK